MVCPSAPTGEVCLQASGCSHGGDGQAWWQRSSTMEHRGVGGMGDSGSKYSSSSESMRQSSSEPGSDCQAPGYPCSGRGNVCDYLLCKPPKLDKGKEWGRGGWTVKSASTGSAHCLCAPWRQADLCFGYWNAQQWRKYSSRKVVDCLDF